MDLIPSFLEEPGVVPSQGLIALLSALLESSAPLDAEAFHQCVDQGALIELA
jgi:hypothetical protein